MFHDTIDSFAHCTTQVGPVMTMTDLRRSGKVWTSLAVVNSSDNRVQVMGRTTSDTGYVSVGLDLSPSDALRLAELLTKVATETLLSLAEG